MFRSSNHNNKSGFLPATGLRKRVFWTHLLDAVHLRSPWRSALNWILLIYSAAFFLHLYSSLYFSSYSYSSMYSYICYSSIYFSSILTNLLIYLRIHFFCLFFLQFWYTSWLIFYLSFHPYSSLSIYQFIKLYVYSFPHFSTDLRVTKPVVVLFIYDCFYLWSFMAIIKGCYCGYYYGYYWRFDCCYLRWFICFFWEIYGR